MQTLPVVLADGAGRFSRWAEARKELLLKKLSEPRRARSAAGPGAAIAVLYLTQLSVSVTEP